MDKKVNAVEMTDEMKAQFAAQAKQAGKKEKEIEAKKGGDAK